MFNYKLENTSLLDLSFDELRNVSWKMINIYDFVDEIFSPTFLTRLNYADPSVLADFLNWTEFLTHGTEYAISKCIDASIALNKPIFELDNAMFYNTQYSREFLEKYEDYIPWYYAENQQSLTPELVDNHYGLMDTTCFFNNILKNHNIESVKEFINYQNGKFKNDVLSSYSLRLLTKTKLNELGIDAPEYYNTVINEQRIMSGEPCNDGQRSFIIWLRKYRRITKTDNYPTWNELLEFYEKYPSMNQSEYINWIYDNCLLYSETTVSQYPSKLLYLPKNVTFYDYENVTSSTSEEYEIEFSDVLQSE